jgi:hypothetical protein
VIAPINARQLQEAEFDVIAEPMNPSSLSKVRKAIVDLVSGSALEMVANLIEAANAGQVGPAKYLFEITGLFPAALEQVEKPEDSLANILLKQMGLPIEPVPGNEDSTFPTTADHAGTTAR